MTAGRHAIDRFLGQAHLFKWAFPGLLGTLMSDSPPPLILGKTSTNHGGRPLASSVKREWYTLKKKPSSFNKIQWSSKINYTKSFDGTGSTTSPKLWLFDLNLFKSWWCA